MPGADDLLAEFTEVAVEHGLQRVVLLSGRGEEAARRAERRVTDVVPEWTVLRSAFFMQDFSEHFWLSTPCGTGRSRCRPDRRRSRSCTSTT
ncbi:MAG: hypothetical protein ACR2FV_11460 [Ornithinimicrobium sp.]|uniref:hypothetical protein n=1 Tax=Ornithinimicrobium sp. TaxID=1977084 RepID=UPI003D9B9DE7